MFSSIAGTILIISGVTLALNPERLKKQLKKKGMRSIKRIVLAAGLSGGALMISLGIEYTGIISKIIAIAGIFIIFKMLYLAKSKSAALIEANIMKIPQVYIRLFAFIQIAIGIIVALLLKK